MNTIKGILNSSGQLNLVDDLPEPEVNTGEVKVRVHYCSLNPTDIDIAKGHYDFFLKLYGAKSPVRTGLEFSGTVMEGGQRFKKGDRVFGYTHLMKGPKTHREVLSINENYVTHIPEGLGFAEASAAPIGLQTSLVALRDLARTTSGDRVLINGASGGVGVYAIQIAKWLGAHVTAVAGPAVQGLMKQLGADEVLNYREQEVESLACQFDSIFDLSCQMKFKSIRHLLKPEGVFIPADPMKNIGDMIGNPFRKQKTAYLMVDKGDHKQLSELAQKFGSNEFVAPESLRFDIEDFRDAIDALGRSGNPGRIVLKFKDNGNFSGTNT